MLPFFLPEQWNYSSEGPGWAGSGTMGGKHRIMKLRELQRSHTWLHSHSRCDSKDSRAGPNPAREAHNPPGFPPGTPFFLGKSNSHPGWRESLDESEGVLRPECHPPYRCLPVESKRVYSAGPFLLLLPPIGAAEPPDPSCVGSAWKRDGSDIDEAANIDTALTDGDIAPRILILTHAHPHRHVHGLCRARAGRTVRF